jgi:DNA-binding FrmR family transcriptional regulator
MRRRATRDGTESLTTQNTPKRRDYSIDTGGGYAGRMSEEHPGPHGYSGDKQALLGRLRRIEGQIRGLQRMVDEDTYCIDVLTQISAAKSALQAVAVGLLEDHLAHCVVDAARAGDPAAKVKEASDAIARLVKS